MPVLPEEVESALSDPFDPSDVKFKPQIVKDNRALAMGYIDARLVQDRLDDVVGVANWSDEYAICDRGDVVCRLKVKIGGEWIQKSDVGSPSEQPDDGDKLKAAFSDALKRAAVKFGIGRYLYRLPAVWVDYDPVKKQLVQPPRMPDWAVPASCKPCGPQWSDRLMKLVQQSAELSGKNAATIIETAVSGYRYPKGTTLASVKLADAKDFLRRLGAWIAELSTGRGRVNPEPEKKPEPTQAA